MKGEAMTAIDEYLATIEPAKRKELERILALAKEAVPDAEETIVYRMPTLKYAGKAFLGFNAHKNHIGLYPYSSQTIRDLAADLHEYEVSSGAIRVPLDKPISKTLLRKLISARLRAIRAEQKMDY